MPTYETSASIAAPRDEIWRVLSDVAAWPEWLPTVSSVEPLDSRPLAVGSRYRVRQPRLQPATWVVTELEPARRFVWVARSLGLRMVAEHTVDERAPGVSTVALRFSFNGLLAPVVGRLFGSLTQSYLVREAASLKQRAEAPR